jgi:hypothetical protein
MDRVGDIGHNGGIFFDRPSPQRALTPMYEEHINVPCRFIDSVIYLYNELTNAHL